LGWKPVLLGWGFSLCNWKNPVFSTLLKWSRQALTDFGMIALFEGSGDNRKHVGYLKKFKFADKGQNLERLGRILGMFNERRMDLPADWDSRTLEEQEYFVKHGFFPTGITAS
jgi:hypothetical protein